MDMNVSYVMTVIGTDRPGLVGQLSAAIADHGGNWLESRMAHLGGQFAGILRIEVPAAQEQKLLTALQSLATHGLAVSAHKTTKAVPAGRTLATVELVGHDRPGIVCQISQVLAQHQVNVEELDTHCDSAPMSGEMLFRAVATVQLPPTCTLGQLRQALEAIATDMMVDIAVMPSRPAA
jgi:glycine cleavage system regulatory protein